MRLNGSCRNLNDEEIYNTYMNWQSIVIIVLLSLINNWLVQLSYYLYVVRKNPVAFVGHRTLLDYWTGVVGDGVIAPLINIFIYFVIVNTGIEITASVIIWSYVIALWFDILTHYFQARQSMTNWSMPKPYQWNGAGKWHMVSFSIQVAYLIIYIYTLIQYYDAILRSPILLVSVVAIATLSFLFIFLFWVDYTHVTHVRN